MRRLHLSPASAVAAALVLVLVSGGRAARAEGNDDPVFVPNGVDSGLKLPAAVRDPSVPLPAAVLGHRIGESYSSPEEIAAYARALAAASPRVTTEVYGRTPEGRDLLLVTVTSPANHDRLPSIRADLKALAEPATAKPALDLLVAATPAVVWIACGVHGDEPSGGEAAMALLYWLAASKEPYVEKLLAETVVVVDPCANPDGRARHVAWWRSVASARPDADAHALENDPAWPGGRTNHDGFDLNRDWAWATQPETRARIAAVLATPPQVYVDLHEMDAESTYFFPPAAEPVHPRIPAETRKWLDRFGRGNARAFDARGWSFFVGEVFDLFYPGYGDSWPSFHGAVGMTYEVAGPAGLAYRRKDGSVLTLEARAIRHFTAVRATLDTAYAGRRELLADFAAHFRGAVRDGKRLFLVPADQDPARVRRLAEVLALQGIRVERTQAALKGLRPGGKDVPAGSLLVDAAQPLARLVEALLEPSSALPAAFVKKERDRFLREEPDRFFDVTAWSLPLSSGLESVATTERARLETIREPWVAPGPVVPASEGSSYGWLLPGDSSASRAAAGRLGGAGVAVLVGSEAATVKSRAFPPGTFLVRREGNGPGVEAALARAVGEARAEAVAVASAWTDAGPSLGSGTFRPVKAPRVVVVTGDGADVRSVGAVTLALREGLGVSPTLRRASTLPDGDLTGVTALVVPQAGGAFPRELLSEEAAASLRRWVEDGGVVVGIREGAEILRTKPLSLSEAKRWEPPKPEATDPPKLQTVPESAAAAAMAPPAATAPPPKPRPSAAEEPEDEELLRDLDRRPLALPGAALRAKAFPEHPLLWGTGRTPDFLVVDGRPPRRLPEAAANVVSVVATEPLAAGVAWREALERWAGAPLVQVESVGKGKVVSFAADPVFRGAWLGTEIVFLNAILLLPQP